MICKEEPSRTNGVEPFVGRQPKEEDEAVTEG